MGMRELKVLAPRFDVQDGLRRGCNKHIPWSVKHRACGGMHKMHKFWYFQKEGLTRIFCKLSGLAICLDSFVYFWLPGNLSGLKPWRYAGKIPWTEASSRPG